MKRRDDIPDLANYFFNKHRLSLNPNMKMIDQRTVDILREYDWPGNVRELENTVKKALVLGKGEIFLPQHVSFIGEHKPEIRSMAELKSKLRTIVKGFVNQKLTPNQEEEPSQPSRLSSPHSELIGLIEELLIEEVLERTGGNRTRASEWLGIALPTLRERIDRYNKLS